MDGMRNEPVDSFRAKASLGWLWVLAFTLLIVVPLPIAFASEPPASDEALIVSLSMIPLLGLVPYASITGVEVQNLRFSPWSSFRFPGLALWKVTYTGVGQIRMCSTRSHKGVLVITAGKDRYGISPAEEDRFVHSLRAAVERATQGATADTAPRSR